MIKSEASKKRTLFWMFVLAILMLFSIKTTSIEVHAQTANPTWQVHLNNPSDGLAHWYPAEYDRPNMNGISNIKLPIKELSIDNETGDNLIYSFDPTESGFPGGVVPANSYQQITRITNNSTYPVTLSYNGGSIIGELSPYIEQWISGDVTLNNSNPYPFNAPTTPAPAFLSEDLTLPPGGSTPEFAVTFGMPWSTDNSAMALSLESIEWSWDITYDTPKTGTVTVHYVDAMGNILYESEQNNMSGTIGNKYVTNAIDISGYKLLTVPDNASGEYLEGNQDVNYVYSIDYQVSDSHIVNEKINYVDQLGNELIPVRNQDVTLVTVNNPITGEKIMYYKAGAQQKPNLIDNNGNLDNSWIKGKGVLPRIDHPSISNMHVIKNTDTTGDLMQTAEQQVDESTTNLNFTVVYETNYQLLGFFVVNETIHYVDSDGNEVAPSKIQSVTSVTVYNSITGEKVPHYKSGVQALPELIDNNGNLDNSWIIGDAILPSVENPKVKGMHVIKTTDLSKDLSKVSAQKVNEESKDLDFIITYDQDVPTFSSNISNFNSKTSIVKSDMNLSNKNTIEKGQRIFYANNSQSIKLPKTGETTDGYFLSIIGCGFIGVFVFFKKRNFMRD